MIIMRRNYERLQEQDEADTRAMANANSAPLHYTTSTPQCKVPTDCPMCWNAARLSVQWYRERIELRVVNSLMDLYNIKCEFPHGGD